MRRVSLNARRSIDDVTTGDIQVVLLYITHPSLDAPIRLSTDPTERITESPLAYATRSTWLGSNPLSEPFLFILASTILPSDLDDAASAGNIILENVDNDMSTLLRSFTDPPTLHMAVVLATSPNLIEAEWHNMLITASDIEDAQITLSFGRDDIEDEYSPAHTQTRNWFPALFG